MTEVKTEEASFVQMPITISEEVKRGVYSNMASVSHTEVEFYIDFVVTTEKPTPMGAVVSRVFMAPLSAKSLMVAVSKMVVDHESKFGPIKDNSADLKDKG